MFKADNVFIDYNLSAFFIADSKETCEGVGSDDYCLQRILEFINGSQDKDSIALSWCQCDEFDFHNNKITFDGDLIVSIYSVDELIEDEEPIENRTLSNWAEAEDQIRMALGL